MNKQSQLRYLKWLNSPVVNWLLFSTWIVLFIGGLSHYTGSWFPYTVFSFVFLILLLSGIYQQISYGYLFLVLMLWLGFWFKLTVHTLLDFSYGEPVGLFNNSPSEWDKVLWISTIGGASVLLTRFLYALTKQPSTMIVQKEAFTVPAWYAPVRKWMWFGLVVFCIAIAVINMVYGIQQSGLTPRTIFAWPLNAIGCWLIGYGLTLGIATLLWWDIANSRNISIVVYFVLLEAFSTSVSMLSRGGYIFHVIPQFFALYKNRNQMFGWRCQNIIVFGIAFVVLFIISNPLVNSLRFYYYYADISFYNYYFHNFFSVISSPWLVMWITIISFTGILLASISVWLKRPITFLVFAQKDSIAWLRRLFFILALLLTSVIYYAIHKSENTTGNTNPGLSASLTVSLNETLKPINVAKFAVDRWLGLEGVMAVLSYPEKSNDLFMRVLTERGEVGKGTIYQEISQSWSRSWDMQKFQVGTLPGAVAFFYLTGHYWAVALGMIGLTIFALSSEWLVFKLTSNPLLSALWGGTTANAIIQMGVAPRGLLIYFFEMSCAIAAIWLIQSKYFSAFLKNFKY